MVRGDLVLQEILKVAGAEDVSEDTAQKVAMFCVSSVGCSLFFFFRFRFQHVARKEKCWLQSWLASSDSFVTDDEETNASSHAVSFVSTYIQVALAISVARSRTRTVRCLVLVHKWQKPALKIRRCR